MRSTVLLSDGRLNTYYICLTDETLFNISNVAVMIRRLKWSYMLYNIFQKRKLQHNVPLYRKLGLNKKYYSPVSSADFEGCDASRIKSGSHQKQLSESALYNELSASDRLSVNNFDEEGFAVLKNFLQEETVNQINNEIESLLSAGAIKFRYRNKLMFAYQKSPLIKSIGQDDKLLELLDILMGGKARLFQSINFIKGSQQKTHSDSIHMTTFPLGGLLGVWLALEDIDETNGPLHYFPGSHKLPYYLNSDYDNIGSSILIGDKDYSAYEEMLADKLNELQIDKKIFKAKKGDVLIWHANLLHGGEPQTDKNRTRKSMVFHYFDEECICYHEISQRPALIN